MTPTTPDQIRAAIGRAYTRITGRTAPPGVLDALAAQASLETARGQFMLNFNLGGIKGASPRGETARSKTVEVLGGKKTTITDGFRAYRSLDEGAEDYVRLMQRQFTSALREAARGSLDGFAHALKEQGYYTASETDYARALHALAGDMSAPPAKHPHVAPSGDARTTPEASLEIARVLDATRISLLRIARDDDDSRD
jgi:hypothetical protein